MYKLLDEVTVKGIGLCTIQSFTHEQSPRFMVKDRRGRIHSEIAFNRICDLQPETVAINTGMSAQIIEMRK